MSLSNIEDQQLFSATKTQFIIFNLFGDYILQRGGQIWTRDLLYLLKLLDINEGATRATLLRLVRKGWFINHKVGRRSRYEVTPAGLTLLDEGNQRLRESRLTAWNGLWYLVVYSLPESKRDLRNALRKRLIWLGFGNLAPGTWVTPHNRQADLEPVLTELEVRPYVRLFQSKNLGFASDQDIVDQCWAIPTLEAEYLTFVNRYIPDFEKMQAAHQVGQTEQLSPQRSFTQRFWLTYDFQPFPRKDPNLPAELLPTNWIGGQAWQLFFEYRQLLDLYVDDFLDSVVRGEFVPTE